MKATKNHSSKIFIFFLVILGFALSSVAHAQNVPLAAQNYQSYINNYTSNGSLPAISFPNIKPGSTISGNMSFSVQIPLITGMTAQLVPVGSTVPKATATAIKLENDYWSVNFNSKSVPNGNYNLAVKVTLPNGQAQVSKIPVVINNSSASQNNAPVDQTAVNQWINKIESTDSRKIQQNINQFMDSMIPSWWLERYFHESACTDESVCGALADPDNDGLTNIEEFRLGTDPTNPDTAGTGHTDSWEFQNGYNPLTGEKINYQNPKDNGQLTSDIYKVLNAVSSKTTDNQPAVTLTGSGLPKSYVTVFVYSDLPTVLTVETNANGDWSYTLNNNNIADGNHEVYVAVTDDTGKITAKSQPFFFVKTAQAITVIAPNEASAAEVASPVKNRQFSYMLVALAIAALSLLMALLAIGIKMSRSK